MTTNLSIATRLPPESDLPPLAAIKVRYSSSSSPRHSDSHSHLRLPARIGLTVDLSDESAFAVEWVVHHYLRPGDAVILIHVRPTSVLYGADRGSVDLPVADDATGESQQKLEDDFDAFTTTKASDLAQPLVEAQIPFKIHIMKDHDMKEALCLEVERLGLSAGIMGSPKRGNSGRLGSVRDDCVRLYVCPVVVVRYPDERDGGDCGAQPVVSVASSADDEAEMEYHDATDDRKVYSVVSATSAAEDEAETEYPDAADDWKASEPWFLIL
ncbi:universal stress protein PHOS32-like [Actinidia eriantha]|uniref:universal stress protein PHOS32-like n=1 Tax=Actinidia eriantha TaxID=165200 RepID=UPI00258680DD|nr:universal stress protein PHOS32-like [Actinidia eriantha]